jgi:hypothetical protein
VGFFLWSLIVSILHGKDADEIRYHAEIEQTSKTFQIVGEPGEVEAMAQETYDSQPELKFYWHLYSSVSESPRFPDHQSVQHVEQAIEDEES